MTFRSDLKPTLHSDDAPLAENRAASLTCRCRAYRD
jgi:hypothetical protein